jgi:hypothetical protein
MPGPKPRPPTERVINRPAADNGQPVDLSQLVSPPFRYTLRDPDTDERQQIVVPFEDVVFDLQADLPTAFKPTGVQLPGGAMEIGLQRVLTSLRDGTPLPPSLPSIQQVVISARRALRVPDSQSKPVVLAVLGAWMQVATERYGAKKDMPGSPASAAPTQASSGSKP